MVFECDDVIHHTANALKGVLSYVHRFRAFMWTDKKESSKLHLDAYFSKKSEKKILCFKKYPHTCGDPAVKSLLFDRGKLRRLGVYKFSREEAPPSPLRFRCLTSRTPLLNKKGL